MRQDDRKRGALAELAGHTDFAAAVLNDLADDGQAEPGAASLRLGGEEWFEDVGKRLVVHAQAGVAHHELRAARRCGLG